MGLRASVTESDVERFLRRALATEIRNLRKLSGGASRQSWSFDAGRPLVVQIENRSPQDARIGIATQARVLRAAAEAGVPVPLLVSDGDDAELGASFLIVECVDGETIPRKILRDQRYASARNGLAGRCGTALARIHSVPLDAVPDLRDDDQIQLFRNLLDAPGEPHPAFELGFRWLEANVPPRGEPVLVHGDFRNGNLIVGEDGLRAVIDWELAHVGDPMEDLGWLCVKSWRFGGDKPVGGFGTREELFEAYEASSGRPVNVDAVAWWEVFGTLRWGIICVLQAARHLSGRERSIELAAIGRRTCEVEHDLMLLLP